MTQAQHQTTATKSDLVKFISKLEEKRSWLDEHPKDEIPLETLKQELEAIISELKQIAS